MDTVDAPSRQPSSLVILGTWGTFVCALGHRADSVSRLIWAPGGLCLENFGSEAVSVADNGIPADRRRMIRRVMRPCHSERFSEGYRPVGGRV